MHPSSSLLPESSHHRFSLVALEGGSVCHGGDRSKYRYGPASGKRALSIDRDAEMNRLSIDRDAEMNRIESTNQSIGRVTPQSQPHRRESAFLAMIRFVVFLLPSSRSFFDHRAQGTLRTRTDRRDPTTHRRYPTAPIHPCVGWIGHKTCRADGRVVWETRAGGRHTRPCLPMGELRS